METEIIITNILHTKTAFGIIAEGTEAVFIPGKVAEAASVRVGQTVKAKLIPNQNMPEKTPWMAIFIGQRDEVDDLSEQICADLERGPATGLQIARSIGQPVEAVLQKLREMSSKRKLVHDVVYALSLADLIEDGEE